MYILGLNSQQADAAAVLIKDGRLLWAIEEERLRRVKHWLGFPSQAIRRILDLEGIDGTAIDHVVVAGDGRAHRLKRLGFLLQCRANPSVILDRFRFGRAAGSLLGLADALGRDLDDLPDVHAVEHHPCHLASAFYVSPFEEAAVCSIDGSGDFVSACLAHGRDGRIDVFRRVYYPHSLGFLYTAVSQYLGFPQYGDEYKVMGLAAYGAPALTDCLRRLVKLRSGGRFALDLKYFLHGRDARLRPWREGDPTHVQRTLYSRKLVELLGPARQADEPIDDRHRAIAASLQAVFEEVSFHVLRQLWKQTRSPRLCLAGGCVMNSVLAGKIRRETPFESLFIQPAAGDAGTALGAAFSFWHEQLGRPRGFVMEHALWGSPCSSRSIKQAVDPLRTDPRFEVESFEDDEALCRAAACMLAQGRIVGWIQGRMEWGARALGNRSILADPRRADTRERMNRKIKKREDFRPFAASILPGVAQDYYEDVVADPFMLQVHPVRGSKRALIPAVTHVDGSGRVQTVDERTQPLFARLIRAFNALTGVPLLLNTSFNESEPIVETPAQALDCFLRTRMDALVLGSTIVRRRQLELSGESTQRHDTADRVQVS